MWEIYKSGSVRGVEVPHTVRIMWHSPNRKRGETEKTNLT
jgi:hypothetical protein